MSDRMHPSVASSSPVSASCRRSATTWPAAGTASSTAAPASARSPTSTPPPSPPASPAKCATSTPAQWVAPKDVEEDGSVHPLRRRRVDDGDAGRRPRQSTRPTPSASASRSAPASAACSASRRPTIKYHEGGPRKISPFYVPSTIINMMPGQVSIMTGIKGPNISAVSACTTANAHHRPGDAHDPVRRCRRDDRRRRRVRGSSPTSVGGFCSMKAMSTRNDDPTARLAPVGHGPRRLRAGRRRRHPGARGIRARQGARRAHLLRARRLRHERRRLPHDRAERERRRRRRAAWRNAIKDAGINADADRLHQRARHLDAAGRPRRDDGDQARARRPRATRRWSARPSR